MKTNKIGSNYIRCAEAHVCLILPTHYVCPINLLLQNRTRIVPRENKAGVRFCASYVIPNNFISFHLFLFIFTSIYI
jgi:hypothetical protein